MIAHRVEGKEMVNQPSREGQGIDLNRTPAQPDPDPSVDGDAHGPHRPRALRGRPEGRVRCTRGSGTGDGPVSVPRPSRRAAAPARRGQAVKSAAWSAAHSAKVRAGRPVILSTVSDSSVGTPSEPAQ